MMRWCVFWFAMASSMLCGQGLVSFEGEEGTKRVVSATVPIGEGIAAAVAVVGANPSKARFGVSEDGSPLKLLIHDPVSRLTLLQMPVGEAGEAGPGVPRGSSKRLKAGSPVYLDPDKKDEPSRVVTWENRYRDNVLPLALMRVHHPGDSPPPAGSPLFAEDGRLVAVCHQEAKEFGNGTYALPVEVIDRVAVDLRERGKVVRCWIGIVMEVKHAVPAIMTVRPGSPAAAAGVEENDILLRIGSRQVDSYADAVNAFYYLVSGDPIEVEVMRKTDRLTLSVTPEVNPSLTQPAGDPGASADE
ncbi:MAG: serine protease [Akkermansiaceae bacterium]|nr:serine protease [Akkermansiaceae bacterium]